MLGEARETPATTVLGASWVAVFAAMLVVQRQMGLTPPGSLHSPLPISGAVSHLFGDQTWAQVRGGEVWRTVTATFVHGNLLHLGLNLLGLIQLGRLIEPWYRSGLYLLICLVLGAGGNLVSGLLRQAMISIQPAVEGSSLARLWPAAVHYVFSRGAGVDATIHSAGGSTILLGLMGLILVVGWRSRTRMGLYLRDQMVILLVATAGLGLLLAHSIDNFGHAGGALVGCGLGFVHRPLLAMVERPRVQRFAWALSLLIVVGSMIPLARDSRREFRLERAYARAEQRAQAEQEAVADLAKLIQHYGRLTIRSAEDPLDRWSAADWFGIPPDPVAPAEDPNLDAQDRATLAALLTRLQSIPRVDWNSGTIADLDRVQELTRAAIGNPPNFAEAFEFTIHARRIIRAIQADLRSLSAH